MFVIPAPPTNPIAHLQEAVNAIASAAALRGAVEGNSNKAQALAEVLAPQKDAVNAYVATLQFDGQVCARLRVCVCVRFIALKNDPSAAHTCPSLSIHQHYPFILPAPASAG